jgi:predicted DNA-binding protein
MKKKKQPKPVPVWVRNEQLKIGLWMPAKLLTRLYHLADIKCRTKTAELITAIESHLERENYSDRSNIMRSKQ